MIGPNGQPLANVVVIVSGNQGIDRRVVSDPNGAYVFGGLQPGPYRLRVEDPGPDARPFSVTDVTLAPGEQRQFDIRLQPVPPPPPPPPAPPTPVPSARARNDACATASRTADGSGTKRASRGA